MPFYLGLTLSLLSAIGAIVVAGSRLELSWWGWANFLLVQWTGFRIARVISDDDRLEALAILGPVLPMSGWWTDYIGWPVMHWRISVNK